MTNKVFNKTVNKKDKNIHLEWDISDLSLPAAKKPDGSLAVFGCGCGTFKLEGTKVVGVYGLEVGEGVDKSWTLFLEDGKPLYLPNEKGVQQPNYKNKANINLILKLVGE